MQKQTILGNAIHFSDAFKIKDENYELYPVFEFNNPNMLIQINNQVVQLSDFYILFFEEMVVLPIFNNFKSKQLDKVKYFLPEFISSFNSKYMFLVHKDIQSWKALQEYLANVVLIPDYYKEEYPFDYPVYQINSRNTILFKKEKQLTIQHDPENEKKYQSLVSRIANLDKNVKLKYNIPNPDLCYRIDIENKFLVNVIKIKCGIFQILYIHPDTDEFIMMNFSVENNLEIGKRFLHNGVCLIIGEKYINSAIVKGSEIKLDRYSYFQTIQPGQLVDQVLQFKNFQNIYQYLKKYKKNEIGLEFWI